ncbi:UDP-N-acetylmuramoyl-tripeptide--D-alanyl-D-alanine ligase [Bacillus sp. CGMCC 1.16607]|uniref:UDP-N-acetylmuramoyl-tripeptide--D-alanyl-D- alanine ligase n=1 Tax=Bacillus sp. CGMCC 1.16607 TaxID=3351842 RepID=UPI003635B48B
MIQRTVKQVAEMITVLNDYEAFENLLIQGVCTDSREIKKGNLFIPFIGENIDRHQFVEDVIERGAAASLWQKNVPNPPTHLPILIVEDILVAVQELAKSYRDQLNVKVIGVTGSNGKTTTKDMVANLLSLQYKVQKTEGNFNNHIGLPLTILRLEESTEMAVLEMGMSGLGEIDFLSKLAKPDAVIITNIGEAHLLDLGSREGITEAKLEIINGLKDPGYIVYYGDEPLLRHKLDTYQNGDFIHTFGRSIRNTIYPTEIISGDSGSYFKVNTSDEKFYLPVLGTHNIMNALAAMLIATHFDIPFSKLNEGFKNLKLTSMRMELVEGKNGEKIINDAYNASPTSMNAAIELITYLPGYEQKILVLGDMLELGPKEDEFHYNMGQTLNPDKIDFVFTYGKLAKQIAMGASESFHKDRIFSFLDKNALIQELKKRTNNQTLVLVKASRGMELEEVVAGLQ